jgi:NTP pyrophosphatase (non-canonical NTP hydrolase)
MFSFSSCILSRSHNLETTHKLSKAAFVATCAYLILIFFTLKPMFSKAVPEALAAFVAERDWAQFHTPENLAKSVAIEAGELLECFQWGAEADPKRVREELADVLTYCLLLADRIGADPEQIVLEKLEITRKKYPVDKARGSSKKYDEIGTA